MRSCCSPRSRGCGAAVCTGCMRRRMRTWMRWPRAGGGAGCRLRRGGGGGGVPGGARNRGGVREGGDAGRLRRQGLRFLEPGRALAALGQVLAAGETFVAVADVDWARFAPVYRAARSWRLLDELAEVRALASVPVVRGAGDAGLAARLAGLAEAGRDRVVTDLVRVSAAAVLGHVSAEAVGPGPGLRALGGKWP